MFMSAHTRLASLQRNSWLSVLNDADRVAILRQGRVRELRRRQRIYHAGSYANAVYLVESGVVKLAVESSDGREAILGFQYPGDLFGELAVIDDPQRDHLAEAHENSIIWAIPREVFLGLMRESTTLGHEVIKLFGRRLRMYRTRAYEILHHSAHARVASVLMHLAASHGIEDADGVVIPLPSEPARNRQPRRADARDSELHPQGPAGP